MPVSSLCLSIQTRGNAQDTRVENVASRGEGSHDVLARRLHIPLLHQNHQKAEPVRMGWLANDTCWQFVACRSCLFPPSGASSDSRAPSTENIS